MTSLSSVVLWKLKIDSVQERAPIQYRRKALGTGFFPWALEHTYMWKLRKASTNPKRSDRSLSWIVIEIENPFTNSQLSILRRFQVYSFLEKLFLFERILCQLNSLKFSILLSLHDSNSIYELLRQIAEFLCIQMKNNCQLHLLCSFIPHNRITWNNLGSAYSLLNVKYRCT